MNEALIFVLIACGALFGFYCIGYADGKVHPLEPVEGAADKWYCEDHPEHLMGHNGCGGAGVPEHARIPLLLHLLRMERQKVREANRMRDDVVAAARRQAKERQ